MLKGYLYILECSDHSYYTGSTQNLNKRLKLHHTGRGANHTKSRLPLELVYVEIFDKITQAYYREKQIQKWSREKKNALITENNNKLHLLSRCKNKTHFANK